MSSAAATLAAQAFTYGRLTGTLSDGPADDELVAALELTPVGSNIFPYLPDADSPYPFVAMVRDGDVSTLAPIGFATVAWSVRYQVKTIDNQLDPVRIEYAAVLVDRLLDGKAATVALQSQSGQDLGTYYVEASALGALPIDLPPDDAGNVYQQLGSTYQYLISRLP